MGAESLRSGHIAHAADYFKTVSLLNGLERGLLWIGGTTKSCVCQIHSTLLFLVGPSLF